MIRLVGKVVSGKGEARRYTREPWALDAFMTAAGIDPFPGTLNLAVPEGAERTAWLKVRTTRGILLPAPSAGFCDGRLFRAEVTAPLGRCEKGAIVVPMVPGYPEDQLEIIAAVGLRDALEVRDGDEVAVKVETGS
jgi:riboflavin kinase